MKKILKWLGYFLLLILGLIGVWAAINFKADIPIEVLKTKYANGTSKFVEIDGGNNGIINVHYRDEGNSADSIPLVLIHGTGSSLFTWDGWVKELGKDFRIIRLDLPAYGLTGPNKTHDYSMEYYAITVRQVLEKLNVKSCYIAGNSLGGGVAWKYAVMYPTLVKKLILVDAAGYPIQSKSVPIGFRLARMPIIKNLFLKITPKSIVESSLKNVYFDDSKVTPALVEQFWEMTCREGNRAAFMARMEQSVPQKDASGKAPWEAIKTISAPTLILWGEHDMLITLESAKRLHQDLPNDSLIVYPNAGHVPMEEIPSETARDVAYFLKLKK